MVTGYGGETVDGALGALAQEYDLYQAHAGAGKRQKRDRATLASHTQNNTRLGDRSLIGSANRKIANRLRLPA